MLGHSGKGEAARRGAPAVVALLAALALAAAAAAAPGGRAGAPPSDPAAVKARMVSEVETGLQRLRQRWWWRGWLRNKTTSQAYSSIWDTVQVFEAYAGLAAASPSSAHTSLLIWFAGKSEGYWNPALAGGTGGFSTGYLTKVDPSENWFDDNGWLGLAFMDTYRVTHRPRFLKDARRAFAYLFGVGWDPSGGGIWWNVRHTVKAAESVNTAALLAVLLYQQTGNKTYLRNARTIIDWANAHLLDPASGLYNNHPTDGVPLSYNQSPMLDALVRLCNAERLYCARVAPLTKAVLAAYGGDLHSSPQFDAEYLRFLLDVYALDGDQRFYDVALRNALRIEQHALDRDGFYLHAWDGSGAGADPELVSVDGAALETLAWTAANTGSPSPAS